MNTLKDYIVDAEKKGNAIGHFNVSNSEELGVVIEAATEVGAPVIIGVFESESSFLGVAEIRVLVQAAKDKGLPVFLNADHTYSIEASKEAVDNAFDSVIIDGAEKPFFENIMMTKEVVQYAREKVPGMLVEGELGFIGAGAKMPDEVSEEVGNETQTRVEDAKMFVEETGVDLFAPSVGNIHGLIRSGEPKLNIDRIKDIHTSVNVPLVLHGGSCNTDEEILKAIEAGIRIVHINIEIKKAKQKSTGKKSSDELAGNTTFVSNVAEMKEFVVQKLKVFNKLQ